MPSQFFGLYIAGSGLRASNAALNTTANNISNAQTNGYSRQQVTQQANNALRTFTTYGCAGAGVDTIAIERVRDHFYDVKYWDNNCKYGEYTAKQYYMQTIENYFNDDGTSGFVSIFNKFSACLQSVTTNSSSDASKRQFIGAAKSLTDYFNNMYGNLQELQKDINLEIKQNIDEINSIAEELATLNKQINVIELSGAKANELRDQRELLIDQLSEIVDVSIDEMDIYSSNDASRPTGGTRYVVRIAGGQVLVDGNDYNTITYEARDTDEKVNQTDADGLYRFMWSNGNAFSLVNTAMEGKLRGLVELRDGNNGANFNGTVTKVGNIGETVEIKVTDDYLKNMRECTLSDSGGVINIGNTIYYYESWKFDGIDTYTFTMKNTDTVDDLPVVLPNKTRIEQTGTGEFGITLSDGTKIESDAATGNAPDLLINLPDGTTMKYDGETGDVTLPDGFTASLPDTVSGKVTIEKDPTSNNLILTFADGSQINIGTSDDDLRITSPDSSKVSADKAGKDAKTESKIKYQGIPYYMEQMNAWIRQFADAVNDILTDGFNAYDEEGLILFTGIDGSGKEYTEDDFSKDPGENGYYELTAGNITINSDLIADAARLGTRSSLSVGVEECGQIKEMISLITSKEKFNFRNGTANQMLEMILSDVALNASDANTFCDTYTGLKNTIDNQRNSISGVDEDEEAVSLVKFQNSYTLASKMIQTLTEIYDQLILNTGV